MKNKTIKNLTIISIILIFIDQLSKVIVENILKESIGNNLFGLEARINTGMALGFNEGNIKNILLTGLILAIVIVFIKNQLDMIDKRTMIALSMILSGAISNLIDRFFRGGVYDFIKIPLFTFNIADVLVVIGWILIVIVLINFQKNEKNEENNNTNDNKDEENK